MKLNNCITVVFASDAGNGEIELAKEIWDDRYSDATSLFIKDAISEQIHKDKGYKPSLFITFGKKGDKNET